MARSEGGVLGGFSGKVGSIIGYRLRGKDVIRGLPRTSNKKPSVKQLEQRARFKLIQEWRSEFTDLFAVTFSNHTHERSAQNAAHRDNAGIVVGEYPNLTIDYTKIVISSGKLPGLKKLNVTISDSRMMSVTWDKHIEDGAKQGDQVAFLVCYNEKLTSDEGTAAAYRMSGGFNIQLETSSKLKIAHVYITVLSADRENAANSHYAGKFDFDNNLNY